MGLFSSLCEGCGNPILATFNTEIINGWMSDCVAITRDNKVIRGFYDAYGGLFDGDGEQVAGERDEDFNTVSEPVCAWTENNDGPTIYHAACWVVAGSPREYRGQSQSAGDQGHFFEDGTYDIPEPKTAQDVAAAKAFTKAWHEEVGDI